jgi:4-diphosphocytidyl-2-C-methyl-D-erythritol kinase
VIRLLAPAKLTWSLEVTGVRDDGLHQLRAEMVSLDLNDVLEVERSAVTNVEWIDAEKFAPNGSADLIARALDAAGRNARVRVHKRIPMGGGLGGGSSDAATVLHWCGVEDLRLAVAVGSDVPFCLHGGRAIVTGVGEDIEPLEFEERLVTLFMPTFAVDTASCFRAFDSLVAGGATPTGRNHLSEAAAHVEPRLGRLAEWIGAETGIEAALCGSGSTMFVEGWTGHGALAAEVPIIGQPWVAGSIFDTPVGPVRAVHARTTRAR